MNRFQLLYFVEIATKRGFTVRYTRQQDLGSKILVEDGDGNRLELILTNGVFKISESLIHFSPIEQFKRLIENGEFNEREEQQ